MKTFQRFYHYFYQNYMRSFIHFVFRLDLDFPAIFLILNEYRGIMYKCSLNRAARFLPRLLFVVELESHDKNYHFVNIQAKVSLLSQSLQIGLVTRGMNLQLNFPNTQPKVVIADDGHIVWSIDDQESGILETQPGGTVVQIKESVFACTQVLVKSVLLENSYGFGFAGNAFERKLFDIWIAAALLRGALFSNSTGLGKHLDVKFVGEDGVVRGLVLYFESSAQIRRSVKKSQLSV